MRVRSKPNIGIVPDPGILKIQAGGAILWKNDLTEGRIMAKEVTKTLELKQGESVIKRSEKVGYGKPVKSNNNDLILTNMALIHVKKNLFGKEKEAIRYPLSDIRRAGDNVEVKLGKPDIVSVSLDVYFDYGMEQFIFTWDKEVEEWIAEITGAVTGKPVERKQDNPLDGFDDLINMANSAAGAINKVKGSLGIKSTEEGVGICEGCGATVKGIVGTAVDCPYCGRSTMIAPSVF